MMKKPLTSKQFWVDGVWNTMTLGKKCKRHDYSPIDGRCTFCGKTYRR